MKKLALLVVGAAGALLAACSTSNTSSLKSVNEVAPYPDAKDGYVRSVIYLPELKDEQNAKVELIIGKEMLVDCNIHRLSGTIKQEDLKGWGYQYYVVDKVGAGISTLMACPPDYKEKMEFVTINNDLGLIHYNSRLPIVVYTPQDVQVKYRVWTGKDTAKSATIN